MPATSWAGWAGAGQRSRVPSIWLGIEHERLWTSDTNDDGLDFLMWGYYLLPLC